jgi:hypothetical protein
MDRSEDGVITFAANASLTGDFNEIVAELSNMLPPSDKLPLSELSEPLNSMLVFLLNTRDVG